MKKYLSLFLVLVMLLSSMPLSAFAEGEAQESAPVALEQAVQTEAQETTEETQEETKEEIKEETKEEAEAAAEPEKEDVAAVTEEKSESAPAQASEDTQQKAEEQEEEPAEDEPEPEASELSESADSEESAEQTEPSEPTEGADGTDPSEEIAESEDDGQEEAAQDETPVESETPAEDVAPAEDEVSVEDEASAEDEVLVEDDAEDTETAESEMGVIEAEDLLAAAEDEEIVEESVSLEQVEGVSASTVSATSVRVRWYLAEAGDGYEVQRSTTSNFESGTYKQFSTTIDDSDLTFTGLTCGKTYYYRVRVYQVVGEETYRGPWSKVVSMRTSPSAPDSVSAEALSATGVKLTWDKVSEATGYIVTRDGSEIYRTSSNSTLTYKDTGLTTGTRYDYRVYSYKTVDGEDIQSEEYAQYIDPIDGEIGYTVVPPAPTGLSTKSAGLASITVTWKKVDGADGYYIYRALASTQNFEKWGTVTGVDTLSYTDSQDIATGDTYRYYVTAYVGAVESKPSTIVTGMARPEEPKNLTATYVNSSSIRVSWDTVSGARGYILEVSDSKSFDSCETLMVDSDTTYLDSGLDVGQERFYRVRAYVREYGNGHVESDNSITAWEMTRPLAPTNLKLTNTAYNKIKVAWSRPDGADGYQVYRSTDGSTWTLIKTYDSTSDSPYVTSVNLTVGQQYFYRVRAFVYSSDGTSRYPGPYSEVKSTIAKPPAPASVAATRISGKNAFTVAWSAVSGVDGYRIYYKQNGGSSVYAKSVGSTVLSTTVSGLEAGYTYQFIVLPYRMVDGNRVNGAQANGDLIRLPIDTPTNLKRTAIDLTSLKLSWDEIGGVDGYEVKVAGEDDPDYSYETSVTTNSVTIENLISGYNYVCNVRAYSEIDGERVYGSWSSDYTVWATATPPTGLTARTLYDGQGVRLTWDAVEGATGYIIRRSSVSANSGFSQLVKLEGSSITQYDDVMTLDQIGTKYYYTICSYTDAIGSKTSPFTVAVSATAMLPRPTLTLSNAGVKKANLTWTQVDGADGYAIYRATSADGPYTQIATFAASRSSCTATGLTTGTTYYFRVAAYYVNESGARVYGTRSLAKSIVPSPIAPTGLTGTAYGQSVKLTWNKVTGVAGYRIFRATGTGSYVAVADVTGTSYTDTGLSIGQTYRYKVSAYMNVSGGKAVGVSSSAITKTTALTKATNLLFTVSSATKIYMTWNAVPDADGYQVQRASSEDGEYVTIGHVKNNSCTISGMPTGQYRYIRIRAYVEEDGVRTYASTWSDVKKTVAKPLAVTELTCTNRTKTSLSVNWTKAAGATGYKIYYKKASASSYTLAATIEGDVTAYRVSGLTSGTKYNIKIVATCEDTDGKTLSSNKSAVLTATTN